MRRSSISRAYDREPSKLPRRPLPVCAISPVRCVAPVARHHPGQL